MKPIESKPKCIWMNSITLWCEAWMLVKNCLQLLINMFTSLTPSHTQKSYCHIRSPWLKYYTCQFYKLKMKFLMFLHQGLCQGAAIAGCCHKGRQMGTWGDKRAGGGRILLSRRQDAEQSVGRGLAQRHWSRSVSVPWSPGKGTRRTHACG